MAKLYATGRGKAAVVGAILAATLAGWSAYRPNGVTPPQVKLAIGSLVQPWEGRSLVAYLDRIAKPAVWTICDGDTQNVKPGMVETPAGCAARTERRMNTEFFPQMKACIPGFENKPVSWGAMMLSLAWNIGTPTACRSTAAALGKAGRYLESCLAATRFNRAGGQVIVGLAKRREMGDATRIGEGELCVSGLGL